MEHRIPSPEAPHEYGPPFRVEIEPNGQAVRVRPFGDIDLATVGTVRREIEELVAAGFRRLVLDLRGVTFLDVTALHLLLDAEASARASGWELGLVEPPVGVQRAFDVASLRDRLPWVDADGQ